MINKVKTFLLENWKPISVLMAVGLFIRLLGISYGLPSAYNSTEYFIAKHALSFGARKTLEPLFFIYPTFYSYLIAGLYGLYFVVGLAVGIFADSADFALRFMLEPGSFYLLGRGLNVLFVLSSCVVLYCTIRSWLDSGWSFLIAMLLLFTYTIDEFSFWMIPDALLVLGTVGVLFFIVKNQQRPSGLAEIIFASLICGLTVSTKYNAGFLVPAWIVSLILNPQENSRTRIKKVFIALIFVFTGFLIGSPYWLLSFPEFWTGFKMISSQARYAYNFETGIPYVWELQHLIMAEWLLGFLLLATIAYLCFRWSRHNLPFLIIVIPTFLYVGSWQRKDWTISSSYSRFY